MKGKLEILEEIRSGITTIEKAKQQVLDLFVVSGSCLFVNTLCDECGGIW